MNNSSFHRDIASAVSEFVMEYNTTLQHDMNLFIVDILGIMKETNFNIPECVDNDDDFHDILMDILMDDSTINIFNYTIDSIGYIFSDNAEKQYKILFDGLSEIFYTLAKQYRCFNPKS